MDYSKLSDKEIELLIVERFRNIALRIEHIEYMEKELEYINQTIEQIKTLNQFSDDYINQLMYELDQAKKSNTLDDNQVQQIADKLKHYITQPSTISDNKNKRLTARQIIEADRLKKALKRKSKD